MGNGPVGGGSAAGSGSKGGGGAASNDQANSTGALGNGGSNANGPNGGGGTVVVSPGSGNGGASNGGGTVGGGVAVGGSGSGGGSTGGNPVSGGTGAASGAASSTGTGASASGSSGQAATSGSGAASGSGVNNGGGTVVGQSGTGTVGGGSGGGTVGGGSSLGGAPVAQGSGASTGAATGTETGSSGSSGLASTGTESVSPTLLASNSVSPPQTIAEQRLAILNELRSLLNRQDNLNWQLDAVQTKSVSLGGQWIALIDQRNSIDTMLKNTQEIPVEFIDAYICYYNYERNIIEGKIDKIEKERLDLASKEGELRKQLAKVADQIGSLKAVNPWLNDPGLILPPKLNFDPQKG